MLVILLPHSCIICTLTSQQVQARNQPTEPPKKPEAAPFFLPAAPGTFCSDPLAQSHAAAADKAPAASLRMSDPQATAEFERTEVQRQIARKRQLATKLWQEDPFLAALQVGVECGDVSRAVTWLRSASPVDIERSVISVPAEEPYDQVRFASGACLTASTLLVCRY